VKAVVAARPNARNRRRACWIMLRPSNQRFANGRWTALESHYHDSSNLKLE
jgi:hypothetical protein